VEPGLRFAGNSVIANTHEDEVPGLATVIHRAGKKATGLNTRIIPANKKEK
jgi:hypothetical protein